MTPGAMRALVLALVVAYGLYMAFTAATKLSAQLRPALTVLRGPGAGDDVEAAS